MAPAENSAKSSVATCMAAPASAVAAAAPAALVARRPVAAAHGLQTCALKIGSLAVPGSAQLITCVPMPRSSTCNTSFIGHVGCCRWLCVFACLIALTHTIPEQHASTVVWCIPKYCQQEPCLLLIAREPVLPELALNTAFTSFPRCSCSIASALNSFCFVTGVWILKSMLSAGAETHGGADICRQVKEAALQISG